MAEEKGVLTMALEVSIQKKLQNFTLDVAFMAEKGVMALLGASGCGKSMTLKCIAGIVRPDSGRIVLDGKVLFDSEQKINLTPQERNVGYLFQSYALFPNMTVAQNIMAGIHLLRREKRSKAQEYITAFRLDGLEDQHPSKLSGGQQQRVALARILASEPKILLLDEPFSALDSHLKWQLEAELSDVLRRFDKSAVFVSHNRDEVYRLCQTVAVLSNGRLDTFGEKHALFDQPRTLAASIITGCKNHSVIKKLSETTAEAVDWGVSFESDVPIPDKVTHLGIRAHHFEPCLSSAKNAFPCDIVSILEEPFSMVALIRAHGAPADDKNLIRWEIPKGSWVKPESDSIYLRVSSEKLLWLKTNSN